MMPIFFTLNGQRERILGVQLRRRGPSFGQFQWHLTPHFGGACELRQHSGFVRNVTQTQFLQPTIDRYFKKSTPKGPLFAETRTVKPRKVCTKCQEIFNRYHRVLLATDNWQLPRKAS